MALICGSFPAAEDAVQEALSRAWELAERGRHIDSLPMWVVVVARNLLRDRFRRLAAERRARSRMVDPSWTGGSVDPSTVERRADVARALAALPRRQREVTVLHYYLGLGVAQTGAVLRIPEGTVKSALHRARRSLSRALSDDDSSEVADVAR
jgi:RNA polymerase sigma-70 factor (ECF subfamily)